MVTVLNPRSVGAGFKFQTRNDNVCCGAECTLNLIPAPSEHKITEKHKPNQTKPNLSDEVIMRIFMDYTEL